MIEAATRLSGACGGGRRQVISRCQGDRGSDGTSHRMRDRIGAHARSPCALEKIGRSHALLPTRTFRRSASSKIVSDPRDPSRLTDMHAFIPVRMPPPARSAPVHRRARFHPPGAHDESHRGRPSGRPHQGRPMLVLWSRSSGSRGRPHQGRQRCCAVALTAALAEEPRNIPDSPRLAEASHRAEAAMFDCEAVAQARARPARRRSGFEAAMLDCEAVAHRRAVRCVGHRCSRR
jgi:hypothetical protein